MQSHVLSLSDFHGDGQSSTLILRKILGSFIWIGCRRSPFPTRPSINEADLLPHDLQHATPAVHTGTTESTYSRCAPARSSRALAATATLSSRPWNLCILPGHPQPIADVLTTFRRVPPSHTHTYTHTFSAAPPRWPAHQPQPLGKPFFRAPRPCSAQPSCNISSLRSLVPQSVDPVSVLLVI